MEALKALADLTEISSQIEAAVLSDPDGNILASTFSDKAQGEGVAKAAAELLRAADDTARTGLVQLEAATSEGSVFIVRDAGRFVTAVTGPQPTVGLVFYDLKTCLRQVAEEAAAGEVATGKTAAKKPRKKASSAQKGAGESTKEEEDDAAGT